MQSLENKLDELRAWITSQRECCALILTETWLSSKAPECPVQLLTHSTHRGDWTAASGKTKGGGVCVFINNLWCGDIQTVDKHFLPNVSFCPYYLSWVFTAVFLATVYIPP